MLITFPKNTTQIVILFALKPLNGLALNLERVETSFHGSQAKGFWHPETFAPWHCFLLTEHCSHPLGTWCGEFAEHIFAQSLFSASPHFTAHVPLCNLNKIFPERHFLTTSSEVSGVIDKDSGC